MNALSRRAHSPVQFDGHYLQTIEERRPYKRYI